MSKEELEKEIKNYIDKNCKQWETDGLTADDIVRIAVLDFAEPRETRIVGLEAENEWIRTKYYELQDTLKKVRLALIKERTANIMNYGKGGVEMFDDCFEILKGVSN